MQKFLIQDSVHNIGLLVIIFSNGTQIEICIARLGQKQDERRDKSEWNNLMKIRR